MAMADQMEPALCAAQLQHCSELDPSSLARLRATDYHARLGLFERVRRLLGLAHRR
jgi:hypothetical protein